MKKTMVYKGYEIEAKPEYLEDKQQWRIHVDIWVHRPEGSTLRPFGDPTTFPTEEEAVKNCLNFGRQIIDGEVANCTVRDL